MPQRGIDQRSRELLEKVLREITSEELLELLRSFLSSAEIKDISRRFMAAKLLKEENTYEEITEIMGMSAGTINKIYFKTKGSPTVNKLFRKS